MLEQYELPDCTPETNTSEFIVDSQWYFPMDFQWYFQTESNLSVVCSKGLSLVKCFCYWNFQIDFQWHFPNNYAVCEIWCVTFCPETNWPD